MFQSRTGWAAVVVTVIGALTAVDVMPLLSTFLTDAIGADLAHKIGAFLSFLGVVVAKLSAPKADAPAAPQAE